jgi:hypothetical protein
LELSSALLLKQNQGISKEKWRLTFG